MSAIAAWRPPALLSCALLATAAQAQDESPSRSAYVVAGAMLDEDDSSNVSIELGLPLGRHAWLYAGAGQESSSSATEDLHSNVLSAGLGFGARHVELTAGYTQRKDGAFKQGDWSIAFDWRGERGGLGADLFFRSAEAETIASIERRRRAPLSVRIVESLDAVGYGLHGDLDLDDRWNVFAAAMTYDYDEVDTNRPFLSRLLFLSGSGVTRDQAFLDHSLSVGATYRFSSVSVTLQYLRDEALETHAVTDTGELALIVLLGDRWSLAPSIGYSDSEAPSSGAYGGLMVGYNW